MKFTEIHEPKIGRDLVYRPSLLTLSTVTAGWEKNAVSQVSTIQ